MFDKFRRFSRKSPQDGSDARRIRVQLARYARGNEPEVLVSPVRYHDVLLVPAPEVAYSNSRDEVRRRSADRAVVYRKSTADSSFVYGKAKQVIVVSEHEVQPDDEEVRSRVRAGTGDSGYCSLDSEDQSSPAVKIAAKMQSVADAVMLDIMAEDCGYDIGESCVMGLEEPWCKVNDDPGSHCRSVVSTDSDGVDSVIKTWLDDVVDRPTKLGFPRVRREDVPHSEWDVILNRGIDDDHPSRIAAARCSGGMFPDDSIHQSYVEGQVG
ncbi:hypothetical protein E8E14_005509 [Neopestalotiopsis sp. 37M]|nr:hypothetical protein E8E14_005509 [Neopestalotiopsis sp. 37M]